MDTTGSPLRNKKEWVGYIQTSTHSVDPKRPYSSPPQLQRTMDLRGLHPIGRKIMPWVRNTPRWAGKRKEIIGISQVNKPSFLKLCISDTRNLQDREAVWPAVSTSDSQSSGPWHGLSPALTITWIASCQLHLAEKRIEPKYKSPGQTLFVLDSEGLADFHQTGCSTWRINTSKHPSISVISQQN